MIKRLATFAAVCGLAVLPALPAAASNTQSFSVSATVNTIATLSFPSSFTYNFTSSDNTNPALAASNNGGSINANLRSTAGTGAASIFFTAPATVPGAVAGNSIPINAFTYTCVGSYVENTGLNGAQTTTNVNTSSAVVQNGSNNNCVVFTAGGHSVASSAITLNLFLDDRFIPADSYTSSGFAVTVSAT